MAEKYIIIADKLELELKKMRSEGISALPSEQRLAETFSCSRQTVRAALDVLQQKGLIEKRKGSGSYITGEYFKNKTVFFITEDRDRYQCPALISGLRSELAKSKYELKVFSTSGDLKEEAVYLDKALNERPAALIIEPLRDLVPGPNDRLIREISGLGIPVICCNSANGFEGSVNVAPAFYQGGRILTEHLLENSRTKIACILRMDNSSGMECYKGHMDAVVDRGLAFDDRLELLLTYREEKEILTGNDRRLAKFIDEVLPACDAVICQNGMTADILFKELVKRGCDIPRDIEVACFDNCYYSDSANTPVLSLGYENDLFCRTLAKTAVASAEGKPVRSTVIPVKING